MKIYLYPIKSILSNDELILNDSRTFITAIENYIGEKIEVVEDPKVLKDADVPLILVQSGGSEGFFKDLIYKDFSGPYYLLTYGSSNSLAASLEILTFINSNNLRGEVLHGSISYICKRIRELSKEEDYIASRLGVLGTPSDWLIASNVDYEKAKETFGFEIIDIESEVVNSYIESEMANLVDNEYSKYFTKIEVNKAYAIYRALKKLITDSRLDGITIRCFDIIGLFKTSSCLALSLLNKEGYIATCEGDVPSLITMKVISMALGVTSFQANPQEISTEENTIHFAHCTLPLNMCTSFKFDTHFESQIGVGIHGEMKTTDCTIVKVSPKLDKVYIEEGKILDNEYRNDRCRTQIKIKLNGDVSYFLKNPLANHHIIIYGHHKDELKKYFDKLNLEQI